MRILPTIALVLLLTSCVTAPDRAMNGIDAMADRLSGAAKHDVQAAVDKQMIPEWYTYAANSVTDDDSMLDEKQARLNHFKEWASGITDTEQRRAYLYWASIAQDTIDRHRQELAKDREAESGIKSLPHPPTL